MTPPSPSSAPPLPALVLAAGAGRRFGTIKQLAPLHGRPLLEHTVATAVTTPGIGPVTVVLGAHAATIRDQIDLHGAHVLIADDWEEGQAASLRAGIAALPPTAEAVIVLLGDQPQVSSAAVAAVLARRDGPEAAVRAVHAGVPGHPVLLKRALFPAIGELRGDSGARALLATVPVCHVDCGAGSVADGDTPEQLRRLQA